MIPCKCAPERPEALKDHRVTSRRLQPPPRAPPTHSLKQERRHKSQAYELPLLASGHSGPTPYIILPRNAATNTVPIQAPHTGREKQHIAATNSMAPRRISPSRSPVYNAKTAEYVASLVSACMCVRLRHSCRSTQQSPGRPRSKPHCCAHAESCEHLSRCGTARTAAADAPCGRAVPAGTATAV